MTAEAGCITRLNRLGRVARRIGLDSDRRASAGSLGADRNATALKGSRAFGCPFAIVMLIAVLAVNRQSASAQTYGHLAGREVVVTQAPAEVRSQGQILKKLPLGSIVRVDRVQENWLWIPEYQGYLHGKQVIPIEEASAHFDALIADQPTAHRYVVRSHLRRRLGQWEPAIEDLNEALRLIPHYEYAIATRAELLEQHGQRDRAQADYNQLVEISKNPVWARIERAHHWMRSANYLAAVEDLEVSRQRLVESLSPATVGENKTTLQEQLAEVLSDLGWCRFKQGDLAAAESHLNAALEQAPADWFIAGRRRIVWRKQGKYQEVWDELERIQASSTPPLPVINETACFLATCPESKFRDGPRAVQLAERCVAATQSANADYLDTLASAQAECGDFATAHATQLQALAALDKSATDRLEWEARASLYQQGKPFRER